MRPLMPLTNIVVTSPFGGRIDPLTGHASGHNGVDLRAAPGTPIFSPWKGVVKGVYYKSAGGYQLLIEHPTAGYDTGYAHLLQMPNLKPGDIVDKGQNIAYTGATGEHINAPHLHFTMREIGGAYVDPIATLKKLQGIKIIVVVEWGLIVLLVAILFYLAWKHRQNKKLS